MGRAGRERVERHFGQARMLAEIAAVYREAASILGRRPSARGV
jgi:hypothetical protein